MKKLLGFASLLALSLTAHADVKFINADGSTEGDLCIAAIESEATISFLADELGISPSAVDEIECNGKSVASFARQYRAKASPTQYIISVSNQNPETQLCLAALMSEEEYESKKGEMFSRLDRVESNVFCNGLPIRQFARKYRERVAAVNHAEH